MKVIVTISQKDGERPEVEVNSLYERSDTPVVQRYGRAIKAAIESGAGENVAK